ncbi:MAG: DUF3592 domain-containing protein [Planctomycetaceae bacterium]|nr:DUF3592 domain-containing protein [Planctomycetaceae bacterium]
MNQLKRPLPHLLKALFVCVGVALAYWWITDGVSPLSFFILGGIVNYSAAAYFFQRARYRIRTWKTAKGKIVDMEDFADGPGGSPIVVFTDSHGRKYEFTNFMGGSNRYHVGSRVDVLYDPSRPEIPKSMTGRAFGRSRRSELGQEHSSQFSHALWLSVGMFSQNVFLNVF